jgi:1-acyl-sn-glycerol-3-phosphate acyltransferase
MLLLRSVLFNITFIGWTALVSIGGVPLLFGPPHLIQYAALIWSRGTFALLRHVVGLDWEVRGDRNALRGRPLIAANHQSAWDTIVFFQLLNRTTFVLKKELTMIPFFGWLVWREGQIAVDRKAGAAAMRRMLRDARAKLDEKREIVVFPQGSRVAPGEKVPYQPGVVALYEALGVPVVPLAHNSGMFWGRRSFIKRPGKIVMEILPEIPAGLPRAEFRRVLEERIEGATRRLEDEARRTL